MPFNAANASSWRKLEPGRLSVIGCTTNPNFVGWSLNRSSKPSTVDAVLGCFFESALLLPRCKRWYIVKKRLILFLERALGMVGYASDKMEISSALRIKCPICMFLLPSLTHPRALGPIGRSPRGGVDGF